LLQPLVLDSIVLDGEGPVSVSGAHYSAPDSWVVLNESPGGYAMRLQPIPQHCVYRVGDVVGVRAAGQDAWMIGCIRWLQTANEGEAIEVGVQVLAPKAEAAMVRPTIVHQDATFQPCLLLPEVAPLKQPPLIIAPRGTFAPMRELSIYRDDGEVLVRVAKLMEQTIGYDMFEYVESPPDA
jgi:hypothetical protein